VSRDLKTCVIGKIRFTNDDTSAPRVGGVDEEYPRERGQHHTRSSQHRRHLPGTAARCGANAVSSSLGSRWAAERRRCTREAGQGCGEVEGRAKDGIEGNRYGRGRRRRACEASAQAHDKA
jgi:hypothetical protein